MKATEFKEDRTPPLIGIVDDDEQVRRALGRLMGSLGMRIESFGSPAEYLERGHPEQASCLLLDVQLPKMTGFSLYARILKQGLRVPVIFVTGHPSEETRLRSARAGAVALLEKPVDDLDLQAALGEALLRGNSHHRREHA